MTGPCLEKVSGVDEELDSFQRALIMRTRQLNLKPIRLLIKTRDGGVEEHITSWTHREEYPTKHAPAFDADGVPGALAPFQMRRGWDPRNPAMSRTLGQFENTICKQLER